MDIKIGDKPEPMTDDEIYLYAMTKFAEAEEYNARVERERREQQQRLYKLEHKASNSEVSAVVVVIVFIIALVMCMF